MSEIFPEHLRADYDAHLWDAEERSRKAAQLRWALHAAGLWNEPQRILDVGCGAGLLLARLDNHAQRVGCDVRVLASAPARAAGVQFVQASGVSLSFAANLFELVVCLAVIGEFPDWREALAEMARCVAPGGCLYVTVANSAMLLRRYALQGRVGRAVRESWWSYARACLPIDPLQARNGFGLAELQAWHYTDVTPYLVQANFSGARVMPLPVLAQLARLSAPSFGHAWRRP